MANHSTTMKVILSVFLLAGIPHTKSSDTIIKQMRQLLNKPTNSLTIRQQNVGDICKNHKVEDFVANTNDCRKFYMCAENNEAIEALCPNNMYFNSTSKLCDLRKDANCPMTGNGLDFNTPISSATDHCASMRQQTNQIMYIGSSDNCQQYYICYYGKAVLQECSENLHWNAFIGQCDTQVNAACTVGGPQQQRPHNFGNTIIDISATAISRPATTLSFQDIMRCPEYGEHIFPYMSHCSFYIYCIRGTAILQQCPFFNHFDILTQRCQWRTSATCVQNIQFNN